MTTRRIVLSALVVAFGVFLIVFGGMDDSPGAQMLGLVAIILSVVGLVRNRKK